MPKDFDECVKNGGRVRTINVGKDKYMRICYLNGKSHAGETHEKKEEKK